MVTLTDGLKWKCGICHEIRDDDKIDVISYPFDGLPGAERNLKFCRDKTDCHMKAEAIAKKGKI